MVLYILTYAFSLFDLFCTRSLVKRFGLKETEANPIGRLLLKHPAAAYIYKIFVVGAALFALWYFREHTAAVIGIWIVFAVFTALTCYHVYIIRRLARGKKGSAAENKRKQK